MAVKFVIVGGGPGGNQAATYAARLGAEVTLIEREIVGGAAHLWDCIPSKAMIATGGACLFPRRLEGRGLDEVKPVIESEALARRIGIIEGRLNRNVCELLDSQGVRILRGSGRMKGPHQVAAETKDGITEVDADAVLISTGSRPRIPDWCQPDGERILTTRQCYPPPLLPEHLVVIGSGVTGVEFVHMFSTLGSRVSLLVSRQQVLPNKDAEVAAALEEDFLRRGVSLLKGARAVGIDRTDEGVLVHWEDGRVVSGSHALLAIGSVPNTEDLGLEAAGVDMDRGGYITINHHCQSTL